MHRGDAHHTGHTDSYYAATANDLRERPAFEGERRADVCVIGGGFTGVSTALHLAERGYDVMLLEAERLGWGASGRNGGHVGIGQRRDPEQLERMYDRPLARELWNLGLEACNLVKELVATHRIACDLKHGILHVAARPGHAAYLREQCERLQTRFDYSPARFVDRDETRRMVGSERFHAGALEVEAAHLHPLNYLLGLAAAAERAGARLYEHSRVTGLDLSEPATVRTAGGTVTADYVVMGCNAYLGTLNREMAARIMPINNFVLATGPLSDTLARELIRDDVAVQDTLFVINYWKLSGDNRLLFGGGENYGRRFPRDMKTFVRKYMLRIYPQLADTRIDYAWGGTLAITMNRMPSFGRLAGNVFYAQGYSGHGVPTATLAGKLMSEAIAGTAERFDLMAGLPTRAFPGGMLLRWPGLVLGMLYYSLRDKL